MKPETIICTLIDTKSFDKPIVTKVNCYPNSPVYRELFINNKPMFETVIEEGLKLTYTKQ